MDIVITATDNNARKKPSFWKFKNVFKLKIKIIYVKKKTIFKNR